MNNQDHASITDMPDSKANYLKNMAALWSMNPHLAVGIDAVMDDERPELTETRTGLFSFSVPTGEGRMLALASRFDPQKEASQFISKLEFDSTCCFAVLGMGAGYHVQAIADNMRGDSKIIVSEPSLKILAAALQCIDIAQPIRDGKILFLTRIEKNHVHQVLDPISNLLMLGLKIVTHPPSRQLEKDFHDAISSMLTDYVAYYRTSLMTLVRNAQTTCSNISGNLAKMVSTPPINILRKRFSGYPAIVISAGPSLRKNIDLLAEARGKAVLLAVQTTFIPLMERAIKPDYVLTLDYHPVSAHFFQGMGSHPDIHMIAEPKAAPETLEAFDGPISILSNTFAEKLIGSELAKRDGLKAGSTVAHLAFYLAEYLGCSPIIFVGQDLAFTNHVQHVPGVERHRMWGSELNRFNTLEMKEWDTIARNRNILRKVKGIDGTPLYTNELMFTYLEQFEKDIASCTVDCIDATEGGASIRGTTPMSLSEAIQQFCQKSIPEERFAYRSELNWNDSSKLEKTLEIIEKRSEEIQHVRDLTEELITLLTELKGLVNKPDIFNSRLTRVDELRTAIHESRHAMEIVGRVSQMAEWRRFRADRLISASNAEGPQRALNELKRDTEFIQGIRDGVTTAEEVLDIGRKRLKAAIAAGEVTS